MIVEIHLLQNFASSNLNRDETGQPKSCLFGGYPRARVSSQCDKRAVRMLVKNRKWLADDDEIADRSTSIDKQKNLGTRSKTHGGGLIAMLVSARAKREGVSEQDEQQREQLRQYAESIVGKVFAGVGLKANADYLRFFGNKQLAEIEELCLHEWTRFGEYVKLQAQAREIRTRRDAAAKEKADIAKFQEGNAKGKLKAELEKLSTPALQDRLARADAAQAAAEQEQEALKERIAEAEKTINDVSKRAGEILQRKYAADVAMFGSMITERQEYSVDAACQVAHLISTHAVGDSEEDYFTALDELINPTQPKKPGAAMIDVNAFNSACYYQYANVDTAQLTENLRDGAANLPERTVEAFFRGFVDAVPTGKKNGFATPTMPALVVIVVREAGAWSLANAFVKPVEPTADDDLIAASIRAFDRHFGSNYKMYGKHSSIKRVFVAVAEEYKSVMSKLLGSGNGNHADGDANNSVVKKDESKPSLGELVKQVDDVYEMIEDAAKEAFPPKAGAEAKP